MRKLKAFFKFYSLKRMADKLTKRYNTEFVIAYRSRVYVTTAKKAKRDRVPFIYYYSISQEIKRNKLRNSFISAYVNGLLKESPTINLYDME